MKKLSVITVTTLAVALLTLQSCKRGENDPTISFKSRTERLVGDWNLVAKQGTEVTNIVVGNTDSLVSQSAVYALSGGTGKETVTTTVNTNASTVKTYLYTFAIQFKKEGDYTYNAVFFRPTGSNNSITQSYTGSGNWNWVDKGKDKVALRLNNEGSISGLDTLNANTSLPYSISNEYYLDRLSSKDMTWLLNAQANMVIDSLSVTQTLQYTFNLEKK